MNKENKWRERFDEEILKPYSWKMDVYLKVTDFIEETLKEEKKKWEINREVGVSEVLAFEAGQKEERANLLEKIEEYFKDKCSWEIFRDIKEIIK